jgi:hypothetical protein
MITVDAKGILELASSLTEVHRAAFPNAVRFSLNDLAFDVKKNTLMPSIHNTDMTIRSESFFRKYSGVEKATGWDISAMQSQVGMMPSLGAGTADKAVERLKEQEGGGTLKHSFVPLENVRSGQTRRGRVRRKNQMSNILIFRKVDAGDKQGFIRAITATGIEKGGTGKGIAVLYGKVLYEVVGFKRDRKLNKIYLHVNRLYAYEENRQVNLRPKKFVEHAALLSIPKFQEIFNVNAERQLAKFSKR